MRLVILGAGGYGHTVADLARQTGRFDEVAFLDDRSTEEGVLGKCEDYGRFLDGSTVFYPAFGNNELRLGWIRRLKQEGAEALTLIHATAYVSPEARVEEGTVILPMAVVNTATRVKEGAIVNCGAIVDHHCVIEAGVHLCPGVIVKAENRIPSCRKIEAGRVIDNREYPV